MTIALILAAGDSVGFDGKLKQLLKIKGETLLGRMMRQLEQRDTPSILVTHNPELGFLFPGFYPQERRWTVETMLSTQYLWIDRTIILLGDVIYSKSVMDRIVNCQDDIRVFGHEFEIFAISFSDAVRDKVLKALYKAIDHAENGGPGKLRKFYQAYCGLDMDSNLMERNILDRVCHVSDYTNDFDSQDEYDNFLKERLHEVDDY
jgi:hypothetical protein